MRNSTTTYVRGSTWSTAGEARLVFLATALAGTIGMVGLIGWLTGASALSAPVPGGGKLTLEAGIALVLLAIAGLVRAQPVRLGAVAGAAGLSALSLAEFLGSPALPLGASGRMPLATSVCVLLLVFASTTRHRARVRQLAALGGGAVAGLVLVGFGLGTRTLAKFSDTAMSVPAAVALVLLGLATLASTPDGWLQWVLRGSDAGAVALRRTLPPVILGLPVLSFLHIQGERLFWNDERVAEAGFVALLIGLVSALLFCVASSLRVLDLQREQARQDLLTLNAHLMTDVRSSFASLHAARQRIGSLEDSQRAVLTVHDDVLQTIFASGMMIKSKLDTGSGDAAADDSVQRTLDCMDNAVRAIRCVVDDLNDQLAGTPST